MAESCSLWGLSEPNADVKPSKAKKEKWGAVPEFSQLLAARLKRLGRKEIEVKGDGNCLYRSLSHQLYGDERHYNLVRQLVVTQLMTFPEKYKEFVSENYEYFLIEQSIDREWGSLLTLRAASELFKRQIVMVGGEVGRVGMVFNPRGTSVEWETLWITYMNQHCNSTEFL